MRWVAVQSTGARIVAILSGKGAMGSHGNANCNFVFSAPAPPQNFAGNSISPCEIGNYCLTIHCRSFFMDTVLSRCDLP